MNQNNKILKIAICINGRPHEGGMTTVVNEYAQALRKIGHAVDVVTVFGVSQLRKLNPGLVSRGNKILKNRPLITLIIYLISKTILAVHIYLNYLIRRYDVIFAMDFSVMNIVSPLKKMTDVKIPQFFFGGAEELVDQGKLKKNGLITKYFFNQQKKSFSRGDLLITSSFFINKIEKTSQQTSPIYFVKSPVNPEIFFPDEKAKKQARDKFGLTQDKFVLLFAGRLDPRKGPLYPLLTLEQLVKSGHHNFFLLYAGQGEEKEKIENYISQNHLNDYVKLLGSVDHQAMVNLYRAADCFLFTSLKQSDTIEAVCLSVLEAIASGAAIVAFFSPESINQDVFLKNNENCLLVPEKDIQRMAVAILNLAADRALLNKLVARGRQDIFDNGWTPTQIVSEILNKLSTCKTLNQTN